MGNLRPHPSSTNFLAEATNAASYEIRFETDTRSTSRCTSRSRWRTPSGSAPWRARCGRRFLAALVRAAGRGPPRCRRTARWPPSSIGIGNRLIRPRLIDSTAVNQRPARTRPGRSAPDIWAMRSGPPSSCRAAAADDHLPSACSVPPIIRPVSAGLDQGQRQGLLRRYSTPGAADADQADLVRVAEAVRRSRCRRASP